MHVDAPAMTNCAPPLCDSAQVSRPPVTPNDLSSVSADELLVLLAVARSGRYTGAADSLGVTHTTVSRRLAALERRLGGRLLMRSAEGWQPTALGAAALRAAERVEEALAELHTEGDALHDVVRLSATDGFSAHLAAPTAARLREQHPDLTVEIVTATRRASPYRPGLDLEVVVGEPQVRRARAEWLATYAIGLYGARSVLERRGVPASRAELAGHGLVYFVDSMLQVDDLDVARREVPAMRDAVCSTNVFVHVEATRAGAGLGLLPCFMADPHEDLVRVLPDAVDVRLDYWVVTRPETARRPAVAAYLAALRRTAEDRRDQLLGTAS